MAAPLACVLLYEIHDVRRVSVCADVKGDCKAYLKEQTWTGTYETCLHPQGVEATQNSACGGCIENCIVAAHGVSLLFGCDIAHRSYHGQTNCWGACDWTIIDCRVWWTGGSDGCDSERPPKGPD